MSFTVKGKKLPKKITLLSATVTPPNGTVGKSFLLKVRYRVEGIETNETANLTENDNVSGWKTETHETRYTVATAAANEFSKEAVFTPTVAGNYNWNFTVDAPGYEWLTGSVPLSVAEEAPPKVSYSAWLECGNYIELVPGEVSRTCGIGLKGWRRNTSDMVEIVFPQQMDNWGRLPGQIQASPASTSLNPSDISVYEAAPSSMFFSAYSTAPPGITPITIIVKQANTGQVALKLNVRVLKKGETAKPPYEGNPGSGTTGSSGDTSGAGTTGGTDQSGGVGSSGQGGEPGSTEAKAIWERTGPFFNDGHHPYSYSDSSLNWTWTDPNTNKTISQSLSWNVPPATLTEGQDVTLSMSQSGQGGVGVGHWGGTDMGQMCDCAAAYDAKHSSNCSFKFDPAGANDSSPPTLWASVGAAGSIDYIEGLVVTWKYKKRDTGSQPPKPPAALKASLECGGTLELVPGETSKSCNILISGWRSNTSDPIYIDFPQQQDNWDRYLVKLSNSLPQPK